MKSRGVPPVFCWGLTGARLGLNVNGAAGTDVVVDGTGTAVGLEDTAGAGREIGAEETGAEENGVVDKTGAGGVAASTGVDTLTGSTAGLTLTGAVVVSGVDVAVEGGVGFLATVGSTFSCLVVVILEAAAAVSSFLVGGGEGGRPSLACSKRWTSFRMISFDDVGYKLQTEVTI